MRSCFMVSELARREANCLVRLSHLDEDCEVIGVGSRIHADHNVAFRGASNPAMTPSFETTIKEVFCHPTRTRFREEIMQK